MEANNIQQPNNMYLTGSNYVPVNQPVSTPQTHEQGISFNTNTTQPVNRLNALDSTLLEKEAYRDIDDETFKIEYKIEQLETELKLLDKQIKSAQDLNDTARTDTLTMKKHYVEKQLKELYSVYNNSDISRKLTGSITSFTRPKKTILTKVTTSIQNFVTRNILSKISKRFSSGQGLKTALNRLETINKNVDELVSLQAPYGEAEEKYEQLTNYLTKANTIQYRVSRELSKDDSKISHNPFAQQTSREKANSTSKIKDKKDIAQKNALNLNNNLKG